MFIFSLLRDKVKALSLKALCVEGNRNRKVLCVKSNFFSFQKKKNLGSPNFREPLNKEYWVCKCQHPEEAGFRGPMFFIEVPLRDGNMLAAVYFICCWENHTPLWGLPGKVFEITAEPIKPQLDFCTGIQPNSSTPQMGSSNCSVTLHVYDSMQQRS